MKGEINLRECNKCFLRNCHVDYGKLTRYELSQTCSSYIEQPRFKLPILLQLLTKEKTVQPTHDLLKYAEIKIVEKNPPKYFELRLR